MNLGDLTGLVEKPFAAVSNLVKELRAQTL